MKAPPPQAGKTRSLKAATVGKAVARVSFAGSEVLRRARDRAREAAANATRRSMARNLADHEPPAVTPHTAQLG